MKGFAKFLFLILLLTLPQVRAEDSPQRKFLLQFQTSRVYFPDENSPFMAKNAGRYSFLQKFFLENVLSWVPTGEGIPQSERCAADLWARRLKDPRVAPSVQLQGALIAKYFKDCAGEIETGTNGDLLNLTRMMSVKFKPQEHPFLHEVVFSLPGNVKLKGLLALKGDFKKRPLVVMRLGVFSNVQEFLPERPWFMMMFEQSPFNVLLLENMSGSDFVANNSRFAFGGYDEGIQNILVAQILKDPNEPLSRLVESLHLFGISLGGHGVFEASLLNPLNSPKGKPLYQSFMAACPVVNLETTMHGLTAAKPEGYFVDLWSRKRLAGLYDKMPAVQDHPSFGFLEKAVSEVARTYSGGLSYVSSVKLPPGVTDGPNFWAQNDFWPAYRGVLEPVLVFATQDDPIVPFALNSQLLQNRQMHVESSNISVVDFNRGVHCTLPISYDWKTLSSLTQAYVLSHAPGFKLREQTVDMEVGDFDPTLKLKYKIRRPATKDKFIKVEVSLQEDKKETREMSLNLPLSEFDFRFLNAELSPSEQWMIERWANQNLDLRLVEKDRKAYLRTTWPVAP
jgi:hypothetical protein